jgi:hypothetical protein
LTRIESWHARRDVLEGILLICFPRLNTCANTTKPKIQNPELFESISTRIIHGDPLAVNSLSESW